MLNPPPLDDARISVPDFGQPSPLFGEALIAGEVAEPIGSTHNSSVTSADDATERIAITAAMLGPCEWCCRKLRYVTHSDPRAVGDCVWCWKLEHPRKRPRRRHE